MTTAQALSGADPRRATIAGWILSGLVIAFLLFDGLIKLPPLQPVIDTMPLLGWSPDKAQMLGVLTLLCTVLYAIPKTSFLGAVLLTAYLGGAVATHARIDSPLFSHTLFGVYVGVIAWAGLWLRSPRLRALMPLSAP